MTFEICLQNHLETHPLLLSQDIIKFCYQAACGAEHILRDIDRARTCFFSEYEAVQAGEAPLLEPLNDCYGRVNLAPWKYYGLEPEELFELFAGSAGKGCSRAKDVPGHLDIAGAVLTREENRTAAPDWEEAVTRYLQAGIRPVHHSARYRQQYHPAYRVVSLSLFEQKIRSFQKESPGSTVPPLL